MFEKILNRNSFLIIFIYILPSILFSYFFYLYFNDLNYYNFAKDYAGYMGLFLLTIILFVKPLGIIFKSQKLMLIVSFREAIGILMFYFFLVHAFGIFLKRDLFPKNLLDIFYFQNPFLWGLLAGFLIFLLGITSNKFSVKILNGITYMGWKKLHYLVYFAYVFSCLHIYFINGEIIFLILPSLFLILKFLEWGKFNFFKNEKSY